MKFEYDKSMLAEARRSWESLGSLRRERRRLKDFAFGRQWADEVRDADGRRCTEGDLMMSAGRCPATNNLIRQLVKTAVGRYRTTRRACTATDARCLEEFLVSGMAVQRVRSASDPEGTPRVVNISPERLFCSDFTGPDASDCQMLGALHDMAPGELLARFGGGEATRCRALLGLRRPDGSAGQPRFSRPRETAFDRASAAGTVRVVEVWRRCLSPVMYCHDPASANVASFPYTPEMERAASRFNGRRRRCGEAELVVKVDGGCGWEQTWLGPEGEVLARRRFAAGRQPQIAVRFYPMIDGEVHSLVADVVPQQKIVNRLTTMLDEVLASTAKGVVLYPTDQIPEGISWRELRRMWATPGSILPFKRTSKTVMPREVVGSGSLAGASQLLRMQLDMFADMSGATASARNGAGTHMSAEAMREQTEQSMLGLLDVLADFDAFVAARRNAERQLQGKEAGHEE